MACKIIVILGVAVLSHGALVQVAQPVRVVESVPVAEVKDYDTVPSYSFGYDVQDAITGDSKAQYETRNGDIVRGSYSLIESDGTRRIVDYSSDPINGFNAIVSREPAIAAHIAAPVIPAPGISPVVPGVSLAESSPGVAASAGPVPAIPSSGPDSDVEVLDARSGRLINGQSRSGENRQIKSRITSGPVSNLEQDPKQRVDYVPVRARASSVVPVTGNFQRLVNVPATRTYSAYSSPFAFAAPADGITYTVV